VNAVRQRLISSERQVGKELGYKLEAMRLCKAQGRARLESARAQRLRQQYTKAPAEQQARPLEWTRDGVTWDGGNKSTGDNDRKAICQRFWRGVTAAAPATPLIQLCENRFRGGHSLGRQNRIRMSPKRGLLSPQPRAFHSERLRSMTHQRRMLACSCPLRQEA